MAKHLTPHKHGLAAVPVAVSAEPTRSFQGLTRKQIAAAAADTIEEVMESGAVFQLAEAVAAMESFAKAIRGSEEYVQYLRDELAKHNGCLQTGTGAKIELCEAGVVYDYSHNAEWRALEAGIAELAQRKKELEQKLRNLGPGKAAVDPETGEVFEGANKKSKSTYRITLAK